MQQIVTTHDVGDPASPEWIVTLCESDDVMKNEPGPAAAPAFPTSDTVRPTKVGSIDLFTRGETVYGHSSTNMRPNTGN